MENERVLRPRMEIERVWRPRMEIQGVWTRSGKIQRVLRKKEITGNNWQLDQSITRSQTVKINQIPK